MKDFEVRALSTSPNPWRIWLRYMDGTFVVHKAEHTQQVLTHLNSLNLHIHFTAETPNQQGSFPFIDTLVSIDHNGSLITTVFRKPSDTHLHIGPKLFVQINSYWDRNISTVKLASADASTQTGSSTDFRLKWTTNWAFNTAATTVANQSLTKQKFQKYMWKNRESTYTSRATIQLRIYWWLLRTRTAFSTREVSSIGTSVTIWDVQWNT